MDPTARQYTEMPAPGGMQTLTGDDDDREAVPRGHARRAAADCAPERAAAPRRRPPPRARFAAPSAPRCCARASAHPTAELDIQPGDSLQFRQAGRARNRAAPPAARRVPGRSRDRPARHDGRRGARAAARVSAAARGRRLRCVRIMHGKGLRSGTRGPVLKNAVNSLLRRCDPVLAFASAGLRDGGTGATLVLLRRDASR